MSENITSSVSSHAFTNVILKATKFIIVSYVISLVLIAALAALVVYTDIPEGVSYPAVKVITLFGAFLSSVLTAKGIRSRGWLCGALTGCLNSVILLLIGMALSGSTIFTMSNLLLVSACTLCGSIGGIIAVNTGNN